MDSLLLWKMCDVVADLKSRFSFQTEQHSDLIPEKNIKVHAFTGLEWGNSTLIVTEGLSSYQMKMPQGLENKSRVELMFLFTSDFDSENWIYKGMDVKLVLKKIASLITDKDSWIGAGHTFPNVSPEPTISIYTEMDQFMLIEPLVFKEELSGLKNENEDVTYLAIIPLFKKELDYKLKNGAYSLMKRLKKNEVTELFEMKRPIVLKRKFFGL
ncbi:MAG: suppressor of fused domain protein [Crocinitomicaceae bacterium]|nr:suppressor of fused domain protein [Crocinitomicaceae bacterium]